jgi:regulatory protein
MAAEAAAVRILAGAAQTELSLRQRLERRGFDGATARAAAAAMAARGYVDDDAFADSVTRRRLRTGHGRGFVAAELRSRGVGERAIDATLAGIDDDAELDAATRLARQLAARTRPGDQAENDPRRWGRIAAGLQRRGFSMATIRTALRRVDAGLPGDSSAD